MAAEPTRTESELRDALRGRAPAPTRLDPDAVIRRVRSRRRPRQVAVGAFATLAVAGVVVVGATTLPRLLPSMSSAQHAADSAERPESAAGGPPASYTVGPGESFANGCGEPTKAPPSSAEGLVLTLAFPSSAPADGLPVEGVATLVNAGPVRLTGSTPARPVITISRDGVTVWHSNGSIDLTGRLVDLAPGESLDFPVSLTPVECSAVDDLGAGFREGLPALGPGTYEVSAFLAFAPEGAGRNSTTLVGGPISTIALQ
jgi:hypothetical protein